MAYVPPLRQLMPLWLTMLLLLLFSPEPSKAHVLGLGPCPHYQSETHFTEQRIDKLKSSGRYSVLLSHNPDLECMSFNFIDDIRLSFDFKDMRRRSPVLQSERGRYIASPNLFRRRGYLRIDMERNGVLGCNPFGPVKLIPLLFTDTYEVWAACTELVAVHLEHLFVLVQEPTSFRTDDVTKNLSTSTHSLPSKDVTSLPSTSTHSLPSKDVTSLPSTSTHPHPSDDVTNLPSNSTRFLPSDDVTNLPSTFTSPLPSNEATHLPPTSANSSLLSSPSHHYIPIGLVNAPTRASLGGETKPEASIQDNVINVTHGTASSVVKRDVAGPKGGLWTRGARVARQTLAADIKDDLIDRGFPHANALRLKYEICDS